MYITGKKIKR